MIDKAKIEQFERFQVALRDIKAQGRLAELAYRIDARRQASVLRQLNRWCGDDAKWVYQESYDAVMDAIGRLE